MKARANQHSVSNAPSQAPSGMLRRQCSCGAHTIGGATCESCKSAQHRDDKHTGGGIAPQIVHDVLRSPGKPLDSGTRAFLEPRFGREFRQAPSRRASGFPGQMRIGSHRDPAEAHAARIADAVLRDPEADTRVPSQRSGAPRGGVDLSHVRVHTGPTASAATRAINAIAFAAGSDIAFRQDSYAPETASGRKLLAHELAHVLAEAPSPGVVTTIRRFASFNEVDQLSGSSLGWKHPGSTTLRVSDDGQMAAEDNGWGPGTNHRAWTTPQKVANSNGTLAGIKSRARLRAKGGGEAVSGRAPASGSSSTLQEIEPIKEDGDPINLASDCGTACRQIMGSGGTDVAMIKKEPSGNLGAGIGAVGGLLGAGVAGAAIGHKIGGSSHGLLGGVIGGIIGAVGGFIGGFFAGRAIDKALSSKEEALTPRTYHGGHPRDPIPTTPEEWSEEIFKKEFGQNLTRQEALAAYDNLSADEKDAFDRKYGINKYAAPRVGQGITIGSEYDMPGFADPNSNAWNFHYAAAVLSSGADYITLESAAGWAPDDWIFYMYGPESKGQSFYEEQRATGTHGTKNTAIVVQPNK